VSTRFVDTVSQGALYEKAARGLVKELNDPYSELFTPKELASFSQQTNGKYAGIGMQIEEQQGAITISRVFPHTPAEAAGVREGDRIAFVDTLSTRGWKTQQVSDYLIGVPGTKVTVKFQRPGVSDLITSTFTRQVIPHPRRAVRHRARRQDRLPPRAALQTRRPRRKCRMPSRGSRVKARRGSSSTCAATLGASSTRARRCRTCSSGSGRDRERPLGAPATRSASRRPETRVPERAPHRLTDEARPRRARSSRRAAGPRPRLVVGSTSFGKGLVQTLFPLDGGYALKITTAKWYTPSGRSIQRERKFVNGKFVETAPDSLETEPRRRRVPAYRSDAGPHRVRRWRHHAGHPRARRHALHGEQTLSKAFAPKQQDVYVTLADYALELSRGATKDFKVQPQWRDEFYRRLVAKGVALDRAAVYAAGRYVDRLLEQRVARLVAGDSTAKRRDLPFDAPLRKAVEVMEKGQSQRDLFTIAAATRLSEKPSEGPDGRAVRERRNGRPSGRPFYIVGMRSSRPRRLLPVLAARTVVRDIRRSPLASAPFGA
jgi:carboxyl-terminal processing protease